MTYLDNAATSWPKPRTVNEAVGDALRRYGANPGRSGHSMSMETAVKVYETRELAAKLFGAEPESVVFTQNCTHALNLVIKGLLIEGDHVVISDLEHNSILRPVHALAKRGHITYSVAPVGKTREETLASFAAALRPNTRLIACTHGSNVWGIRLPVEELAALSEEKGVFLLVDAAQTAGVVPIDMRSHRIDFLCMAGHKGLYGPPGTGMMITSRADVLETVFEGGTGSYSADFNQPSDMPDRFESGTVNTMGILGLGAGLRYILDKGMEKIHRHEMHVAGEIHRRLAKMPQITLYTDFDSPDQLPVFSFNVKGVHSEELTRRLSDMGFALRGGLHCAPLAHQKMGTMEVGAVRVSVGAFNTEEHALTFCAALGRIVSGR